MSPDLVVSVGTSGSQYVRVCVCYTYIYIYICMYVYTHTYVSIYVGAHTQALTPDF